MYELLIIGIIMGIISGFVSHYLAVAVDSWMDYGGIFHCIRVNAFKRYATKNQILELENYTIDPNSEKTALTQEIEFRIYKFSEAARIYPAFKLWICSECISIRIALLLSFLGILVRDNEPFYYNGLQAFPIVLIISIVTIYKIRE